MKIFLLGLLILWSGFQDLEAQVIHEVNAQELVELTRLENDTTYVLNFWASWCAPCVEELPLFEKLHRARKGESFRLILISLDFSNQMDSRVRPFLREQGITAEVRLINDTDYNSWISRVDPDWSGAIPATLIYRRDKRVFLEKKLNMEELIAYFEQIHL